MVDGSGEPAWSPAMTVNYPGTPELFVPMPLPKQTGAIVSESPDTFPRNAAISRESSLASAGPSKALVRSSAILQHGEEEQVAAIMRVSMQVHSPGCLHVILHTIGCQAPYVLQNRTEASFVYRQHGTGQHWCLLRPYSSIGYAWVDVDGALRLKQFVNYADMGATDCRCH